MTEVRDHLAIALDVDDLVEGLRLAKAVQPWFGVAKVGLELFCAEGPDAVTALNNMGFALAAKKRYPEAIGYYERALKVSPRHAEVHNNLGNALADVWQPELESRHQTSSAFLITVPIRTGPGK